VNERRCAVLPFWVIWEDVGAYCNSNSQVLYVTPNGFGRIRIDCLHYFVRIRHYRSDTDTRCILFSVFTYISLIAVDYNINHLCKMADNLLFLTITKNFNDIGKNLRSIFLGTISVLDVYSMTSTSPQSGENQGSWHLSSKKVRKSDPNKLIKIREWFSYVVLQIRAWRLVCKSVVLYLIGLYRPKLWLQGSDAQIG
jgi:hypothetical protein